MAQNKLRNEIVIVGKRSSTGRATTNPGYPGDAFSGAQRSCSQYSLKKLSFSSPAQQVSGSQNRYSSLAAASRPRLPSRRSTP